MWLQLECVLESVSYHTHLPKKCVAYFQMAPPLSAYCGFKFKSLSVHNVHITWNRFESVFCS